MKLVFAPDSFKGSLRSAEMTDILTEEAQKVFPDAELVSIPIADGGEGTVEALIAACGGVMERATVISPNGTPVEALYGLMDGGTTAVIEMAQASGLPLMGEELNPMTATSIGTGMLIRHCAMLGVRKMYIGLGGSATNDGGMGMLTALGVRFLDKNGAELTGSGGELGLIHEIDLSGLMPHLLHIDIHVITDVNNVLLGPMGATRIYGPQKGATPEMMDELERGMAHYADLLEALLGSDIRHQAGSGAAGGMGAALYGVLRGKMYDGINAMLDTVRFNERISGADLVVTGEGRIDEHSILYGKVCGVIAARCAAMDVPVIALVGSMSRDALAMHDIGLSTVMTAVNAPMTVGQAIDNARTLYTDAAARMFRMLRIGMRLGSPKMENN